MVSVSRHPSRESGRTSRPAPAPSSRAGMGTHVCAAVMLASSVLFLAWVRVATLHRGYEISRLHAEQQALLQERRALEVEIGTLRSPARLIPLATKELRMVPPQESTVITRPGGKR